MSPLLVQVNDISNELFLKIIIRVIVTSIIVSLISSVVTYILFPYIKKRTKKNNKEGVVVSTQDLSRASTHNNHNPSLESSEKSMGEVNKPLPVENKFNNSNKHLSKRERKQQAKKERREMAKQQNSQQKETNAKSLSTKIAYPPEGVQIIPLAISDGQLVEYTIEKTPYYCSWKYGEETYYMLNCDIKLLSKAINNHNSVIDLFCDKTEDSVDYSLAKNVITKECGIIDTENNIKKKAIITYE